MPERSTVSGLLSLSSCSPFDRLTLLTAASNSPGRSRTSLIRSDGTVAGPESFGDASPAPAVMAASANTIGTRMSALRLMHWLST